MTLEMAARETTLIPQGQDKHSSSLSHLQQEAHKCDRFSFIHILLYSFNPIRGQLETDLDVWLVNVCMKGSELIKGSHTFGFFSLL